MASRGRHPSNYLRSGASPLLVECPLAAARRRDHRLVSWIYFSPRTGRMHAIGAAATVPGVLAVIGPWSSPEPIVRSPIRPSDYTSLVLLIRRLSGIRPLAYKAL